VRLSSDAVAFVPDTMGDKSLPVTRILIAYHQWLESTGREIVDRRPVLRPEIDPAVQERYEAAFHPEG
jgi:hypothetical protein